jgi:hypothetical protein
MLGLSFYKDISPIGSVSYLYDLVYWNYFLKAPSLNITTEGIGLPHRNFRGDTHFLFLLPLTIWVLIQDIWADVACGQAPPW